MSNSDRVVLVLGGAGTVGSGVVKALLDKGKLPGTQIKPLSSSERTYTGNIAYGDYLKQRKILYFLYYISC